MGDIWLVYKVYKTIYVSPNIFIAKTERKKTQNQEGFYSLLPIIQILYSTHNFWHPQLQNQKYVTIVSTFSKYLHHMNFQIWY